MPQRYSKLENDIKDLKTYHKKGIERIKKYYTSPESKREKDTGLKNSPHEILMKRAENLIIYAYEGTGFGTWFFGESKPEIKGILIGIGTEILLKAIILKEDYKYFIDSIENRKFSFKKCSNKLLEFLPKTLSPKQIKRIKEVFEWIRIKRNNLVHLEFHQYGTYTIDYQILNLLEFLFSYFFKEESKEIVKNLNVFKERTKVKAGMNYEPIGFL